MTMAPERSERRAAPDNLHAYLDGELGPDEAAEVEAHLAADPDAMARVERYARHKELLRESAGSGRREAEDLRTAALERQLADRLGRRVAPARGRLRRAVPLQAAAAVVLLAAGWIGHAQFEPKTATEPGYVAEAVGADRVFAQDFLHPAEFGPEASAEALAWLSTKLGHAVKIPGLDTLGLEFVGMRLLGTAEGPLAYFLYETPDGTRMSMTLARHADGEPAISFATYSEGGRHVGYWSTGAFDYALVAESDSMVRQVAAELDDTITF